LFLKGSSLKPPLGRRAGTKRNHSVWVRDAPREYLRSLGVLAPEERGWKSYLKLAATPGNQKQAGLLIGDKDSLRSSRFQPGTEIQRSEANQCRQNEVEPSCAPFGSSYNRQRRSRRLGWYGGTAECRYPQTKQGHESDRCKFCNPGFHVSAPKFRFG
jgi:hypothetical protein